MSDYNQGVKCPFFKRDDAQREVTCEGIVDGSTITLTFKSKKDFKQQMDVFCRDYCKNCEVYRMIMEAKY